MMTKKDYIRAAEQVRNIPLDEDSRTFACELFVTFFQGDNPRFDAERFRAACEPKAKKS